MQNCFLTLNLILLAILFQSITGQGSHPFCTTSSVDAIFSYNNRVFVLNKATRRVFRLYRSSSNRWTSDELDINQMFDGTLQDFDTGFSIDEGIMCIPIVDLNCDKKNYLYNVTILFFGTRYKSFRPKPDQMDFTPMTDVRQNLMPFDALAEGNINDLTLWTGHRNISSMAYHTRQDLLVTSESELRAGIVVTNDWRLRVHYNPNILHVRGGFKYFQETYFLIQDHLWRVEVSGFWRDYQLVQTQWNMSSFFQCHLPPEATIATTTAAGTSTTHGATEATTNQNSETISSGTTEEVVSTEDTIPPETSNPDLITEPPVNPATNPVVDLTDVPEGSSEDGSGFPIIIVIIAAVIVAAVLIGGVVFALFKSKSKPAEKQATVSRKTSTKFHQPIVENDNDSVLSSIFTINSMTGSTLEKRNTSSMIPKISKPKAKTPAKKTKVKK